MKYIVTGAAGFIGGHVAEGLLKRSDSVVILDNLDGGKQEIVDLLLPKGDVVFYKRSVTDNLDDIFEKEKPDGVFHLAAQPRVQLSIAEPLKTHEANINGTLNILETARKFEVPRVVFSSSSSVYGDQDQLPFVESMAPNPMSPYALHKLVGEYYCHLYHMLYGVETISLRYFNVYGPRQNADGAYANLISKFADRFLRGEVPSINGDGTHTRDYTFVTDVVSANLAAMDTKNNEAIGTVFNVGAGNQISTNDVSEKIREILKTDIVPKKGPEVVEPKATYADYSKAQKLLGWEPKVAFEDGIKVAMDYYMTRAKEGLL